MRKLMVAGLLLMGFLFLGCGGNSGESTTAEKTSSAENNQYGKSVFGRTTFE